MTLERLRWSEKNLILSDTVEPIVEDASNPQHVRTAQVPALSQSSPTP